MPATHKEIYGQVQVHKVHMSFLLAFGKVVRQFSDVRTTAKESIPLSKGSANCLISMFPFNSYIDSLYKVEAAFCILLFFAKIRFHRVNSSLLFLAFIALSVLYLRHRSMTKAAVELVNSFRFITEPIYFFLPRQLRLRPRTDPVESYSTPPL